MHLLLLHLTMIFGSCGTSTDLQGPTPQPLEGVPNHRSPERAAPTIWHAIPAVHVTPEDLESVRGLA